MSVANWERVARCMGRPIRRPFRPSPREQLRERIEASGYAVDGAIHTRSNRSLFTDLEARWHVSVYDGLGVPWVLSSYDTVTDCARRGIEIDLHDLPVNVTAKPRRRAGTKEAT